MVHLPDAEPIGSVVEFRLHRILDCERQFSKGDVGHKGLLVAESEDPVAEQDFWGRDMRE